MKGFRACRFAAAFFAESASSVCSDGEREQLQLRVLAAEGSVVERRERSVAQLFESSRELVEFAHLLRERTRARIGEAG